MKKVIVTIAVNFLLLSPCFSQTAWLRDFELAKTLAKQNNKLIMVDFWAIWCGPCKTMDREVWNTEEGAELSKKFISVKVDIDYNKDLAMSYNVRSIPAVFFLDANGEKIIDQVGFSHKNDIINLMKNLPGDVTHLNSTLAEANEGNQSHSSYKIALAFQMLAEEAESRKIKDAFLDKSNEHLKIAFKSETDKLFLQKIQLTEIHNFVILGAHKKALKKLNKNKEEYPELQENEAYSNFIHVLAYRGKVDKYEEKKYYKALEARSDGSEYIDKIAKSIANGSN